jgi:hypothetical protein
MLLDQLCVGVARRVGEAHVRVPHVGTGELILRDF